MIGVLVVLCVGMVIGCKFHEPVSKVVNKVQEGSKKIFINIGVVD